MYQWEIIAELSPELINIPINIGRAGSLQNAYVIGGGYDEDGFLQGKNYVDLRLYNNALSSSDIEYIYNNQVNLVSVDPVIMFPFKESTREYNSSGIFLDIISTNDTAFEENVPLIYSDIDKPYLLTKVKNTTNHKLLTYDTIEWGTLNVDTLIGNNAILQHSTIPDTPVAIPKADVSGNNFLGIHRDASLNSISFTLSGWFKIANDDVTTTQKTIISSVGNFTRNFAGGYKLGFIDNGGKKITFHSYDALNETFDIFKSNKPLSNISKSTTGSIHIAIGIDASNPNYIKKLIYINGIKEAEKRIYNWDVNKDGYFNIGKHISYVPYFNSAKGIAVNYSDNLNTNNFTISFWNKLSQTITGNIGDEIIVSTDVEKDSTSSHSLNSGYSVRLKNDSGSYYWVFSIFTGGSQYDVSTNAFSYVSDLDDKWNHITCVYSGDTNTQTIMSNGITSKKSRTLENKIELNTSSKLRIGYNDIYVPYFQSPNDYIDVSNNINPNKYIGLDKANPLSFFLNTGRFILLFWIFDETESTDWSNLFESKKEFSGYAIQIKKKNLLIQQ